MEGCGLVLLRGVPTEPEYVIAITCNAVLSWTQANRTRAVVKFVPLVLAIHIFVDVNRHSSPLPIVCLESVRIDLIRDNRRNWHRGKLILACL